MISEDYHCVRYVPGRYFHVYAIELRITTVSVCHICSARPSLGVSLYTSGLVSVSPSQRLTTQLGWRLIQTHWRWAEASEVEARLQRDMEDQGMNHDITPPSKVQCPNARCWLRVRSLRVGAVEFGNELLGALYIANGVPFVLFNPIALPVY